jgi:hypothetical protein
MLWKATAGPVKLGFNNLLISINEGKRDGVVYQHFL